jgi:hypothetical protein
MVLCLALFQLNTFPQVTPISGVRGREWENMGRLYVALLGLLVVGIIVVIQMVQGETDWLHWVGLAAVAIGLASIGVEMQKNVRK